MTLREKIEGLKVGPYQSRIQHPSVWNRAISEVLALIDAHTAPDAVAEADVAAAQTAAAVLQMREAAAREIDCEGCAGKCYDAANCWQSAAADIRALTPSAGGPTALDALIAERVREAEHAGWIRAAKAIKGILAIPQPGTVPEIIDDLIASRIDAARASKEGR